MPYDNAVRCHLTAYLRRFQSGPKTWGNQRKAAGFGPALRSFSDVNELACLSGGILQVQCPLCQTFRELYRTPPYQRYCSHTPCRKSNTPWSAPFPEVSVEAVFAAEAEGVP